MEITDEEICERILARAAIPVSEDLFRGVRIWRVRFVKRRRFTTRLNVAIIHLSVASMAEVFGSSFATDAIRAIAKHHADDRFTQEYLIPKLRELAELGANGDDSTTRVAVWALKTTNRTTVGYLADRLNAIHQTFLSEDRDIFRRQRDETTFARLLALKRDDPSEKIIPTAGEEVATNAAARAMNSSMYRSIAVWRELGNEKLKDRDYAACRWTCRVIPPDRYHVTQAGEGDFDEWITIGANHYCGFGPLGWIGLVDPMNTAKRQGLNMFLGVEKVCSVLHDFPFVGAGACEHEGAQYTVLTYRINPATNLPAIMAWLGVELEGRDLDVRIWIDSKTGFPVLASLTAGDWQWDQAFMGFNQPLEIEIPEATMMSASERSGND